VILNNEANRTILLSPLANTNHRISHDLVSECSIALSDIE